MASIIAETLREIGQDPILVGGAAVEFYTEGGYATRDIDLIAAGGPDLIHAMEKLGFEKLGKDFVDRKRDIYLEFPSSTLKPGEQTRLLQVGPYPLLIVSREDLIVDRLCAFKFWQSGIDGLSVLLLLEENPIDEKRLLERAKNETVDDALESIRSVQQKIIRQKLPPPEANRLLEREMKRLRN